MALVVTPLQLVRTRVPHTYVTEFYLSIPCTAEDYTVSITVSGTPAFGETYTLVCSVGGVIGSLTIQWIGPDISDVSMTTHTSTLTLSDLSLSNAGEYICWSTLLGVVRQATEHVMPQGWPGAFGLIVLVK